MPSRPAPATVVVVGWLCAFGDSITWGAYDGAEGGWAHRLRHTCERLGDLGLSEKRVHALGIPGERLEGVLRRFDVEAGAREAEHFIFAVGINDAPHLGDGGHRAGTDLPRFRLTYEALLEKAFRFSKDILLVGPTNVDEGLADGWTNHAIAPYVEVIRHLAQRQGVDFLDAFGTMGREDLQIDGLHPGPTGHRKLHDAVADRVVPQWRTLR